MLKLEIVTNHFDASAAGVFSVVKFHAANLEPHYNVSVVSCARRADEDHQVYKFYGPHQFVFSPRFILHSIRSKADIVHFHGFWSFLLFIVLIFAKLKGNQSVFVSPHGMLDSFALSKRRFFKKIYACILRPFLTPRVKFHALTDVEALAIKNIFPKVECFVIPNSSPIQKCFFDKRYNKYIFLGRLTAKKNIDLMIDAFCQFNREVSDPKKLDIYGYFDCNDYKERILRKISSCDCIEYKGELSYNDKFECLKLYSHILLFSSSEGQPMALLEGMSAGCLPICTPECNLIDGVSEIGHLAMLSLDEIVQALHRSCNDDLEVKRFMLRQYLEEFYNPDLIISKLCEMYG